MSNQSIKVPRAPDRTVLKLFKTLNEHHDSKPFRITSLGSITVEGIDHSTADSNALIQLISKQNSHIIDTCTTTIKGLSIYYYRGGNCPPDKKSAIFDEIILSQNSNQPAPTPTEVIEAVATINKQLKPIELDRIISSTKLEASSELAAIHHSTLERLEHLNEDLIRKSSEFRANLEAKYELQSDELKREIKEKKNALEAEHKLKHEALEQREQALKDRLTKIDDRNNTHARREIRDKMLSDVKDRISSFGLSRTTERKRMPVTYGILALAITLSTLIALTTIEINNTNNQSSSLLDTAKSLSISKESLSNPEIMAKFSAPETGNIAIYWLWIKLSMLSFGLVGTILYYIKWQNKWAEQHATTELQLQQFYIDVNRANWVIESCLEWRKETASEIPKELIASITNNLFKGQQQESDQVIHPADELASALMGSASKLRLKLGDNEMEFNNPRKITNKPILSKQEQVDS